jgi:hypothetical protein
MGGGGARREAGGFLDLLNSSNIETPQINIVRYTFQPPPPPPLGARRGRGGGVLWRAPLALAALAAAPGA